MTGLLLGSGASQVLLPVLIQGFDYRYLLPALPLLPAAAALGLQLLLERRRRDAGRDHVTKA